MNIGFLGCGKIAAPMVRSLARRFPESGLFLSRRSEHVSAALEQEFGNVDTGENQWVLDNSQIVVISLLADTARDLLASLAFRQDHRPISVMIDISLKEIHELIAPARDCCVTVPLPYIAQGGCPLPVYPDSTLVDRLFGSENPVFAVKEEHHTGAHFAATAILSTLMTQLQSTSRWLGGKTGDDAAGEIYLATLAAGYLGALDKDGKERFAEAMGKLSTPGGLNHQLLLHMQASGLVSNLEQGLQGLGERLNLDP